MVSSRDEQKCTCVAKTFLAGTHTLHRIAGSDEQGGMLFQVQLSSRVSSHVGSAFPAVMLDPDMAGVERGHLRGRADAAHGFAAPVADHIGDVSTRAFDDRSIYRFHRFLPNATPVLIFSIANTVPGRETASSIE
jgi:hypothetical protein